MRTFDNLLITGGCGFIGINLIRYLLEMDSGFTGRIINVDKLSYAAQPQVLAQLDDQRHQLIVADINDQSQLQKILKEYHIDGIIHLAAESHVDRSISGPDNFMYSNILGTFNLLEAMRKSQQLMHLHHVSTDEVFGSLGAQDAPFNEQSAYHPNNPYSASKAASDHLVRSYAHTYGLSTTISHCSNNYGPYQHDEKFIPTVIKALIAQKPIPLYGDGHQIRDWLHVKDHVKALWLIMQRGQLSHSYCISARNEQSNVLVIKLLEQLIQKHYDPSIQATITLVQDRLGHDRRYASDPSRLESLGWQAQYTFAQGLTEYIEHLITAMHA